MLAHTRSNSVLIRVPYRPRPGIWGSADADRRQIRKTKAADKPYKLTDGGGLHVYVTPAGGKLGRLRYEFERKEKLLSIGPYPSVGVAVALALLCTMAAAVLFQPALMGRPRQTQNHSLPRTVAPSPAE